MKAGGLSQRTCRKDSLLPIMVCFSHVCFSDHSAPPSFFDFLMIIPDHPRLLADQGQTKGDL